VRKRKAASTTGCVYLGEKLLLYLGEKSRTWEAHLLGLKPLSLTSERGYAAGEVSP